MSTNNLKIGSIIPKFNLPAVDGKKYRNESFKDKKILIVIFSCNHCPYVQAYEERIKSIQEDYSSKNVQIVAINSNDSSKYEDDSLAGMIKRANEKKFNFPYLHDETQETAKLFDASHTPEVFVFNENRELVYHGKIDDNWQDEARVKSRYLREAIDELLLGEEVSVPETFSIGCTIKWKNS